MTEEENNMYELYDLIWIEISQGTDDFDWKKYCEDVGKPLRYLNRHELRHLIDLHRADLKDPTDLFEYYVPECPACLLWFWRIRLERLKERLGEVKVQFT